MFSVLMPVFNVAAYVEESVRSVLDQDFADLRLIVVDDASTDGTADVVHRLSSADHRLKAGAAPPQRGAGPRPQRGDGACPEPYVMFLDGDDALDPGALTRIFAVCRRRTTRTCSCSTTCGPTSPERRWSTPADVLTSLEGRATAAQRPEVLTTLNVAWNKVYAASSWFVSTCTSQMVSTRTCPGASRRS